MQGGKKKVTNKEKKETPWNHGRSSRTSKAVVEYREDKVEEKKSKHEQYRNDYSKSNGIKLQHQARNFTFHKSSVTYGNADGSYISSSTTRMTGSDGATFLESKKAYTATRQGKRKSSDTATTTRQVKHKISRGLDNKGHSNVNKGEANELLRFEQSWKGNDTRSWSENFSGYDNIDVAREEYYDDYYP
ncbi:uncharacterized protein LOC132176307 [Corylus avellana]|uniref:uncharacterized protein LOC132176307 n=1 Tax=Corylus avellana TaxID=13451 RepID=UPI001E21AB9A|nr:uncharacterized protein LOC132176307 [Corylus avellana]XP_059444456.1 uncharacterized protein LOC132176307 [Corylus avellana]